MKITDTDLILFADDLLPADRKQQILGMAERDDSLTGMLKALKASRLPFRTAFDQQPIPKVPDSLRKNVRKLGQEIEQPNEFHSPKSAHKYSGLNTALRAVVFLAVGYFIATSWHRLQTFEGPINSVVLDHQCALVQRVLKYQSLYVADTAKTDDSLVDWNEVSQKLKSLAESTGMNTSVPDLTHAGYQFQRVQELGFEGMPIVHAIYTKEDEEDHVPLALSFMPAYGERDTSVRLEQFAQLMAADWIADNQRVVLVMDESPETFEKIYTHVAARLSESSH